MHTIFLEIHIHIQIIKVVFFYTMLFDYLDTVQSYLKISRHVAWQSIPNSQI